MQGKRKHHLLLEQLEERIFLDANPVAELATAPQADMTESTDIPVSAPAEPLPREAMESTTEATANEIATKESTAEPEGEQSPKEGGVAPGEQETAGEVKTVSSDPPSDAGNQPPPSVDENSASEPALAQSSSAPAEQDVAEPSPPLDASQSDAHPAVPGSEGHLDTAETTSETTNASDHEEEHYLESIVLTSADHSSSLVDAGSTSAEVIDPMIGEPFTFTVSLDNTTSGTLYGPYIDLYFPYRRR